MAASPRRQTPPSSPSRARRRSHLRPATLAAPLLLAAALAACEDDGVRVYEVAKSEPAPHAHAPASDPPAASAPPTPPTAPAPSTAGEPWSVPSGWRREPGERPMRAATFTAGEGDDAIEIAVSHFPGDAGGLLANVNRWRGQVGLPSVGEEDLRGGLTPFDTPGFRGHTLRLRGAEQHVLGAIIHEAGADRTWFVKATAPADAADRHEADVFAFARSFGAARNSPAQEDAP